MHVNRLYSYDPANSTWADLTDAVAGTQPLPRNDGAAAVLGNRLWIFGGWTDELPPYGGVLNDLHVFDPAAGAAGAWLNLSVSGAVGAPPQARAGHSLVAVGGLIYSFGGYTDWPGKAACGEKFSSYAQYAAGRGCGCTHGYGHSPRASTHFHRKL